MDNNRCACGQIVTILNPRHVPGSIAECKKCSKKYKLVYSEHFRGFGLLEWRPNSESNSSPTSRSA
jgi:hypothetical protein